MTSANAPDAYGVASVTSGTASAYAYRAADGYREDGIAPAGLSSAYAFMKVGARYYDPAFGAVFPGGWDWEDRDLSQAPLGSLVPAEHLRDPELTGEVSVDSDPDLSKARL